MPEVLNTLITIVSFILILGILVFIHELGHYLAARLMRVHVEEFAFGFGMSLWSRKIGKTVYKINLLPFGGYVKLQGEKYDPNDQRDDSYTHKSVYAKLFILLAGITMNILLAIFLFAIFLGTAGYQQAFRAITDFDFVGVQSSKIALVVSNVEPGAPADGNLKSGDVILKADDRDFAYLGEFKEILAQKEGGSITLEVTDIESLAGAPRQVTLNLRDQSEGKPLLGVGYISMYIIDYPASVISAIPHTWNMFSYQLVSLRQLIDDSIASQDAQIALQEVGGVIAVGNLVGQVVSLGDYLALLNLTALLSVALAFFNVLPFPLLDGGQATLEILQALMRRRIPDKYLNVINTIGLVFLLGLSVLITFKDALQFNLIQGILEQVRSVFGR
ncbi:MAG: site-2 protease family protein [Candidatus Doudnabacteria bacterium]|nr:site-2 protease family protein [Candidatus Doudnabacteria bacterium]